MDELDARPDGRARKVAAARKKVGVIPFALARTIRLTCPAQDLSSVSIFRLLILLFFCPLACTVIYSRPPYYRYEQYTD